MRSIVTRLLIAALLVLSVSLVAAPAGNAACSTNYVGKLVGSNGGQVVIYKKCYSGSSYSYYAKLTGGSLGDALRLKASNGVVTPWATAGSGGVATTGTIVTATSICAETRRNTIGGLYYKTLCY